MCDNPSAPDEVGYALQFAVLQSPFLLRGTISDVGRLHLFIHCCGQQAESF